MQEEAACITCKKKHPTRLHGYIPKNKKVTDDGNQLQNDQEQVKSNFISDVKCASALEKLLSKVIGLFIAPVSMKYKNNGKQITTYAMLDKAIYNWKFVHHHFVASNWNSGCGGYLDNFKILSILTLTFSCDFPCVLGLEKLQKMLLNFLFIAV